MKGTLAIVVTVAAALAAAGCSSKTEGTPSPVAQSKLRGSSSASERPQDLSVAGIDPCRMISDAQRARLHIKPGEPGEQDPVTSLRTCQWYVIDHGSFITEGDTKNGIEQSKKSGSPKKDIMVGGYPALQILDATRGCTVAVDVAQGQQLIVDYGNPGLENTPFEEMCRKARTYAEAALTTLKTIR